MNLLLKTTLAFAAVAAMLPTAASAQQEPVRSMVFEMNTDSSRFYRIPALGVAKDGTLVALADKRGDRLGDLPNSISVVARRSSDNGATWGPQIMIARADTTTGKTYGDPAIAVDPKTGRMMALYTGDQGIWTSTPEKRAGFYYSISDDNGATWSGPFEFTDQVYAPDWHGAFITSGHATVLKSGRIITVANVRRAPEAGSGLYEYAIWTDDFGKTWHRSENNATPQGNGNESKIFERADGTLVMSIRATGKRLYSFSTDGGETWSVAEACETLPDPNCNGDMITLPATAATPELTLHSLPASDKIRENVSVYVSNDEGKTWGKPHRVFEGFSAYSSMEALPDGSLGILVEEGKWDHRLPGEDGFNITFYRIPAEWLK